MKFRCESCGAWVDGGPAATTTSTGELECKTCDRTYGRKADVRAAYTPRLQARRAAREVEATPKPRRRKKAKR